MSDTENEKPSVGNLLLILLGVPALVLILKLTQLPIGTMLNEHVSLGGLAPEIADKIGRVLFVPLAAVFVDFVRLTLGLRLLGPFRSILLVVAFQVTGIVFGLGFYVLTIILVAVIRPSIADLKLGYFGRITMLLSIVAALIVGVVMIGQSLQIHILQRVAYFPIVVLCLVGDAFARTIRSEGLRSAAWRATTTGSVAIVLTLIANIDRLNVLLLLHPELLVIQIGMIVVIARFMNWKLAAFLNPVPVQKSKTRSAAETAPDAITEPWVTHAKSTI